MADVQAGQVLTAATFNRKVRKRIARGRRVTDSTSTNSTTEVSVLRMDDIPLKAGENYSIKYQGTWDTTTATAEGMRAVIRYTIDGSTPTTSSTVLPGSGAEVKLTDAGVFTTFHSETDYTPSTDETFSCLVTIRHVTGTVATILEADASVFHTQIWIDCMGDDPGDTGTDL